MTWSIWRITNQGSVEINRTCPSMTSEAAGSIRIATATAMKSRSRSGTEYFRSTGNTPVFAVSGVFVGSGIILYYY
jgi:hypothetical protein